MQAEGHYKKDRTVCGKRAIDKNGAIVDWKTSVQFAIIMGIVLPVVRIRSK